jgi:hypothetical protein
VAGLRGWDWTQSYGGTVDVQEVVRRERYCSLIGRYEERRHCRMDSRSFVEFYI